MFCMDWLRFNRLELPHEYVISCGSFTFGAVARSNQKSFHPFKRFPSLRYGNNMHKNYLGKLASQSDFCAFCLCRTSGKTF